MIVEGTDELQKTYVSIENILHKYVYSKELKNIKDEFNQVSQTAEI